MRSQVRALLVPLPINNLRRRFYARTPFFVLGATGCGRLRAWGLMLANDQIAPLIIVGLSIAAILLRLAAIRARDIKCPNCGWLQVRRSSRHSLQEWLLKGLFVLPYRCLACQNRFFRFGVNFRHSNQGLNNEPANTKQLRAPSRPSPK